MNVWKYINKKESSASIPTTAEEDFSYIYDEVKRKQEELDILYAESVVAEIEAEEERKAKATLDAVNKAIGEAIQGGASTEQIARMRNVFNN